MPTTFYLPKAHDPNIGNPRVQQWVSMPGNGPDELATKLGIPEQLLESQIIGAIPTPWARMLLFEQALFNNNHPLHKSVLQEWRGLLACFCYRTYAGFKLTKEEINIADLRTDNKDSKAGMAFAQAKPDASSLWNRFDLIFIDQYVVGAASPRTIVFCTAEQLRLSNVPWYQSGKFIDPLNYFTAEEDRTLLASWLEAAIEKISQSPIALSNKGRIVDLLEAWKNQTGILDAPLEEYTEFPNTPLSLLPLAIEIERPKTIRSDVLLKPTIRTDTPPLLVSESILRDDARRIYQGVRGSKQLATQLPKGLRGSSFSSEIPYPWINPDELFTDTLIQITTLNDDSAKFLRPTNDSRTFLFPLSKEILDYFTPDDLTKMVNIKSSGRNITVTLHLSTATGRKPEEFSRLYSNPITLFETKFRPEKGTIIHIDTPPVMEMWPDFSHEQWKKNYLFISHQATEQTSEALSFELYPENPKPQRFKKAASRDAVTFEYVWKTEKSPYALIFDFYGGAGILPIRNKRQPNVKYDNPGNYVAAVDFGQSHTTAFWVLHGSNQYQQIVFRVRNIPLTIVDKDTRDAVLRNAFLPINELKSSLDSSLILPSKILEGNEGIVNGTIYLPDIGKEYTEEQKDRVSAGLKWAEGPGEREKVTIFLEQYVTMIEAEAFDDNKKIIEYRWAYPQAFSPEMVTAFQDRWTTLSHKFHAKKSSKKTESMAICQFLAGTSSKAVLAGNSLFGIDIGGSTTDIGVWAENKMQISDSCLLAGWTLSRLLHRNPSIGESLIGIINSRLNIKVDKRIFSSSYGKQRDSENQIALYWNRLLRSLYENSDQSMFEIFIAEMRASGEESCRLVTTIAVATVSTMVFYVGLLAGAWHNQRGKALPGNEPSLFFTGNGGNLLLWTPGGENNFNAVFLPVFEAGYSICMKKLPKEWESIHIERPAQPKKEVAIGLLLDRAELKDKPKSFTITGDFGLRLKQENLVEPSTSLNDRQFADLIVPQGWRSESLKVFVDTFNKTSRSLGLGFRELPDPNKMPEIGDQVRERVAVAKSDLSQEGRNIKLESPFMISSEEYFNKILERGNWSER